MRKLAILLLVLFGFGSSLAAAERLLLVERKQDRRGRDAVDARLRRYRVNFRAEDMPLKEFTGYLALVAGGAANFVALGADWEGELPTVTLTLQSVRLTNLMAIVSDATGFAYVYRNGVIMLKPRDKVREVTELRLYDVRAAVAPLTDFPAPEIGILRPSGYEAPESEIPESGRSLSGFDTEGLAELVRNNVRLGNWDSDGISLTTGNGVLIVRQTESGHEAVEEVLRALGVYSSIRR